MNLSKIPNNPGCYLFKDSQNNIIYIGKAKNLKKRVSSYFNKTIKDEKTRNLVKEIEKIDFVVTDNEVEALILEQSLILKNKPKYNIMLKDMFSHSYIKVTNEPYPKLITVRRVEKDNAKYFGPYTSARSRTIVLKFLRDNFKIRTCKSPLPKRVCLRYHIGRCDAPCVNKITKEDYNQYVQNAVKFLKGENKELINELTKEMKKHSKNLNFERAMTLRNQIDAIKNVSKSQKIDFKKTFDLDVVNYFHDNKRILIQVFNMSKGVVQNQKKFEFEYRKGIFIEFLKQYYSNSPIPEEIILPKLKEENLENYLSKIKKSKVNVNFPTKGNKKKLLDLVKKNVKIHFSGNVPEAQELKSRLKLGRIPAVIDCFDISNILGDLATGSCVRFINKKPDKKNYRRFKIRGVKGANDPAMIQEVVFRMYSSILEQGGDLPDLIVIDGGKTQLNAAKTALRNLNLNLDLIALAKKNEDIYLLGRKTPVQLKKSSIGLKLLQKVRNEAHRFAIKYHKLLRSKKSVS